MCVLDISFRPTKIEGPCNLKHECATRLLGTSTQDRYQSEKSVNAQVWHPMVFCVLSPRYKCKNEIYDLLETNSVPECFPSTIFLDWTAFYPRGTRSNLSHRASFSVPFAEEYTSIEADSTCRTGINFCFPPSSRRCFAGIFVVFLVYSESLW